MVAVTRATPERTARALSWRVLRGSGPRRALFVVLALVLAGTGAGYAAAAPRRAVPRYVVGLGQVRGLGRVLVDGEGMTLYLYRPDHDGKSTCTGICAKQWPPLVLPRGVTQAKAGRGVAAHLLGTTRRANGELQVTYARWPLYLWQGDYAAGQANGEGDDMGLWWAVSRLGKPVLPDQ
jgi:predicted lipoprotein with Yx(FWY)xxD motif